MLTVAILDDGVCSSSFPSLGRLNCSIAVAEDGAISQVSEPDRMTHGTLCAAIIRSYVPDAELISIRVLDPVTRKGAVDQIRYALEWCVEHDVSVINLSVGSVSFKDWERLRPAITRLVRHNIPLVCACSNNEIPSIFTEFTWPIAVEKDDALLEDQYHPHSGNLLESDFCASSVHTLVTSENEEKTYASQNSHAAPVITARVYQLLKEYGKLPAGDLRRILRDDHVDDMFHIKPIPDFIDAAIEIGSPQYPQDLLIFSQDMRTDKTTPFFLAAFPNSALDLERAKWETFCNRNKLLGIMYAGTAPAEVKNMARQIGCLFWDESEYIRSASKLPPQRDEAMPLKLQIRGEKIQAARLARMLDDTLIDSGYRSKRFSDWPQAYCLGMIFLSHPIDSASYIYSFSNHYQLDIFLVCSERLDLDYDMVISCQETSVLLEYDNEHKRYDAAEVSLEQIVREIIELLQ